MSDAESRNANDTDPIETPEDANVFASAAMATIENLQALLAEETDHLRNARFRDATALAERKVDLVNSYARYMTVAQTLGPQLRQLAPDAMSRLVDAHDALSQTAKENLPTVERARDTTFRIVRGMADLVERRQAGPNVYGPGATEPRSKPAAATSLSLDAAV